MDVMLRTRYNWGVSEILWMEWNGMNARYFEWNEMNVVVLIYNIGSQLSVEYFILEGVIDLMFLS